MINFFCSLLFSLAFVNQYAWAKTTQVLKGVSLSSEKIGSNRSYSGSLEKIFPYSLSVLKEAAKNFSNRCNNKYKEKRRFTSKSFSCAHHNENLIESFIDKDLTSKSESPKEAYLLARQIYNRGQFGYYELVNIEEIIVEKNLKKVVITLRMLNDREVKELTSPKFSQESAFRKTLSTYVLSELTPFTTKLSYTYLAETDHWLLNKEVTVPQVFSNISNSINDLFRAIEDESATRKNELEEKQE